MAERGESLMGSDEGVLWVVTARRSAEVRWSILWPAGAGDGSDQNSVPSRASGSHQCRSVCATVTGITTSGSNTAQRSRSLFGRCR